MNMEDTFYCGDCKISTAAVVLDHATGDTICLECGLVLESYFIDETSEWRTFANDSTTEDHDPNRVGGPTNPLLANLGGALSTLIAPAKTNGKGGGNEAQCILQGLNKLLKTDDRSHSHHFKAFATIATMADHLGLVPTIKDRANEIYTKVVQDRKLYKSKNLDPLLAASLYVACNQEQVPRTVKEICSVANGITKKEFGRAKTYIMKHLPKSDQAEGMEMRNIKPGDFVKRFCSNLGIMNNRVMKAAQETVEKLEVEVDVRRSPISIAAAVVYIVSQLLEQNEKKLKPKQKPLRDFVIATGVAEGTIRNVYRDLYPHLGKIIPVWFAKEDALRKLCSP